MNRRYYVALSTIFCTLLLFTFYYSLHSVTQSSSTSSSSSTERIIEHLFSQKHAFATAVCDPLLVEAALVSIYSLNSAFNKKPSSKQDIIVLLPKSLYKQDSNIISTFEKLNTKVVPTDECNLAHLWALLDYQKVVYFSPSILFEDNVDTLFGLSTHAALNSDDTPLFVLEPNSVTFESLLHRKDQFFSIDPSYFKEEISSSSLKDVVHIYGNPMKPWNFHAYSDVDWKKHYDPIGFYKWRRISNELRRITDPYNEWKNQKRQRQVCDKYIQSSRPNHFPISNKFSVLISTYNPDRIEHLSLIIRHLLKSKKVHTVFVTWHNPELEVPEDMIKDRRVKVLRQSYDSLNNRFNPVKDLATDAVYIMDDDIFVDIADLDFTFDVWRSRKDSVVGHFPRLHKYNPDTLEADYNLIGKAPYSIILTKSMFIRSDYLFAYTCLLEPRLHEDVDRQLNCEDLGFSMLASGLSGIGSSFVRTEKPLEDFGLSKGISINNSHMPARSKCISDFITKYWNKHDPLIKSYDTVVSFKKPQIRMGNWNRVEKMIG